MSQHNTGNRISEFEKSSLVLFVMMMAGNVCNYLYQIVMGNLLSVADFGMLNTLLSLSTVAAVPSGILQLIATRQAADYAARQETGRVRLLLQKLLRAAGATAAVFLAVGVLATPLIGAVLNIGNKAYIVATLAVVAVGCLYAITNGVLQGLKRFFQYGFSTLLLSLCKLAGSVLLVALGLGLYGSLAALGLGAVLCIGYGWHALRDCRRAPLGDGVRLNGREIRAYCKKAFGVQIMTTLLSNGDILLVRAFAADDVQVGIYSSGMVIGKIAMYVATAVVAVLFPMVAERQARGEDTRGLFAKAMLYGGGVSAACAVGMNLFGPWVFPLLFGERYTAAIPLLLPISFFVVAVTFITILMNYLTAKAQTRFMTLTLGGGFALIVVLVALFHQDVAQMLYIMGGVLFGVFLLNLPGVAADRL